MNKKSILLLVFLAFFCNSCFMGPVSVTALRGWEEDYYENENEDEVIILEPEYVAVTCPVCGCCVPSIIDCKNSFEDFEDNDIGDTDVIIEEPSLPGKDTRPDNHPDQPPYYDKSNQTASCFPPRNHCLYQCELTGKHFFMVKLSNMAWVCD